MGDLLQYSVEIVQAYGACSLQLQVLQQWERAEENRK